jgi:hypothetical protein
MPLHLGEAARRLRHEGGGRSKDGGEGEGAKTQHLKILLGRIGSLSARGISRPLLECPVNP